MKRFLITIGLILISPLAAFAEVQHITVDQAVTIAIGHNLQLCAKRKELNELYQDLKAANALKNPQFQSNFLIGNVRAGNSSQFGLAVPVEIAKRSARKNVVKAKIQLTENEIKRAEHELKIEVMRAYFNVLYMKSVVKVLQESENLFADMMKFTKTKYKNSPQDVEVLQSDIKYKKQRILTNTARAALLKSQFELNNVMNLKSSEIMFDTMESSLFENNISILKINLPDYQQIEDTAMKYSYSILIVNNQIEVAKKDLSLQKRNRIPDVTVGGGYAYQSKYRSEGDNYPGAYVGVNTTLPLLYWYNPEVNAAKVRVERNQLSKLSFESRLKVALKKDYNTFKYSKDNIGYYQSIMSESEQILKTYAKNYRAGKVPLLSLMLVENSQREMLREYLKEIQLYYNAYLDLMENVGHDILLEDDIFEEKL